MNNDIRIPFGLCDITYNGITHTNLASEAIFEAIPTYEKVKYGQFETRYFLIDYVVSLDLALSEENYNNLKLSNSSLQDFDDGLFDNPTGINYEGKPLVIHPVEAGDSKEYDITIFSAVIDPEKSYTRTFGKSQDVVNVRFLAKPHLEIDDDFSSYFYIGDTTKLPFFNGGDE